MFKHLYTLLLSKKAFFISTLLFCIIFSCTNIKAQKFNTTQTESIQKLLSYSELAYGSDNRLVTGTIYQNKYYNAKGHPYLLSQNWLKATIYIKDNIFSNVDLKYNLHLDKFILNAEAKDGNSRHLILNDDFIDSVQIGNHLFINSSNLNVVKYLGYLESIYSGKTTAFLKHSIRLKESVTSKGKKVKFIDSVPLLYIKHKGLLKPVYSKKDFLNFFYPHKKEIKKHLSKNKINIKKANKSQLISLIQYCDEISSTSKE